MNSLIDRVLYFILKNSNAIKKCIFLRVKMIVVGLNKTLIWSRAPAKLLLCHVSQTNSIAFSFLDMFMVSYL